MSNPWQLYDDLVDALPEDVVVDDCVVSRFALVATSAGGHGLALADRAGRRAARVPGSVIGQDLRSVAALAKSWDFELAALGVAAMNSWFNTEQRVLDSAATLIGDAPCPDCWSWRRVLGPCWSARPPRSRPRSTVAGWTRSVGRGSPTPPWRGNWHAWGPRCGR